MTTRLKITITHIERQTVLGNRLSASNCPFCGTQTDLLYPVQAAATLRIKEEELEAFIAGGNIHFVVGPLEERLICLNSLLAAQSRSQPA